MCVEKGLLEDAILEFKLIEAELPLQEFTSLVIMSQKMFIERDVGKFYLYLLISKFCLSQCLIFLYLYFLFFYSTNQLMTKKV